MGRDQVQHESRRADWTFSEAQRLAGLIQARTQKATFNVVTGIAITILPAVTLTQTVDPRWYLIAPIFLSLMPLMMLEEDKETQAIGARLRILEEEINQLAGAKIMISEQLASRSHILATRYGLYSIFVFIWAASWGVGFWVAFSYHMPAIATIGYFASFFYIVSLAALSARNRDEIARRLDPIINPDHH